MCMEEDKELSRCSHIHAHAVSQCSVFTRACVPLDFFFFFAGFLCNDDDDDERRAHTNNFLKLNLQIAQLERQVQAEASSSRKYVSPKGHEFTWSDYGSRHREWVEKHGLRVGS